MGRQRDRNRAQPSGPEQSAAAIFQSPHDPELLVGLCRARAGSTLITRADQYRVGFLRTVRGTVHRSRSWSILFGRKCRGFLRDCRKRRMTRWIRTHVKRSWRYVIVAGVCALLYNGIMMIGLDRQGVHYVISQAATATVLLPVGYLLQGRFSFAADHSWKNFLRYSAALLTNYPVAIVTLWLLCDVLSARDGVGITYRNGRTLRLELRDQLRGRFRSVRSD